MKTLHPRLHAALLARRDDSEHMATLEAEGIEPIDLVCVNLYPFEQTVARLERERGEAVENIDIGGPTMIRAAAKNHARSRWSSGPRAYDAVLAELGESDGEISAETRQWLANEAFAHTAAYDAAISRWFGARYEVFPEHWVMPHEKFLDLPYGENPHQSAALYVEAGARAHVLSGVAKQHGKALSFNNVLDLDSARRLLDEFERAGVRDRQAQQPLRHGDRRVREREAYEKAFACDPVSAFGGVHGLQPPDRPGARRAAQRAVRRGAAGARVRATGRSKMLTAKESIRILELDPSSSTTRRASATSSASAAASWSRTPTGSTRTARR